MAGRGGAGNILALQQQHEKIVDDVEANRPRQTAGDQEEVEVPDSSREVQPYAYTGRGGAGNYYVPKDLKETGQFHNAHRSHILGDGTAAPDSVTPKEGSGAAAQPYRWQGRGGAGNYDWTAAENEERARLKKLEDDRLKEEKLRIDIEKGVSDALAVPERAKIGGLAGEEARALQ